MPLLRTIPSFILSMAVVLGAVREAVAANGDLIATHRALAGKTISGICADTTDGTYWALGETTGKIYHLDAGFSLIGEIPNPHGTGVFPNLILSRGLAFRASSLTLLVMAKDGPAYKVRELNRAGVEVTTGAFTIDTSSLPTANLHGLAHDPTNDQVWIIDDQNDLVIRISSTGIPVSRFSFPGDSPPETTFRGKGISFRQEGFTPYLYIAYGDIFSLAPSKVLELTVNGLPTGAEVPLSSVPPETAGQPVREIGALMVGSALGRDSAVVVGRLGVIHILERSRPSPTPPSFFRARLSLTNKVVLTWNNHGSSAGRAYPGGIAIGRDGVPLEILGGSVTQYIDEDPPREGEVAYTVKGSNGGPFSIPIKATVLVGKGGLIDWVPFPGREPYDLARNPTSGDVYVSDPPGGKIYHFDMDLVLLGFVPSPFEKPGGLAFNPAGNGGAGSLMVGTTDGVLIREISLQGDPLDLQVPVDFTPISSPRMGSIAYDPAAAVYTCVEATTKQLVSFDRNGRQREICTPPEIFTHSLSEGLAFDTLTGNFHATFEDDTVRELFKSCAPTSFSFDLSALGETSVEANFIRGVEIADNTLLVAAPSAGAIFKVLIFPQGGSFLRGDLDRDGRIRITDAVVIAEYLFKSGPTPYCQDAADTNDDGELDISDPVYLLFHLFLGGPPPPAPYPSAGLDPTFLDNLEC